MDHFDDVFHTFLDLDSVIYLAVFGTVTSRAVTVADFYHSGGNGPTAAGGAVLCIFIYIILKRSIIY